MTVKGLTTNKLIDAIRASNLNGVLDALDDGDDIEMSDMHGCSGLPLRTACFEGNLAIVRELLKRGANPNAMASDGPGAPLRLALRKGHQDIADLLLEKGATPLDGVKIPPETLDVRGATLPDEVVTPSSSATFSPTDEAETPSDFGTDTNLLSMDLLFLEENENPDASPKVPEKR